MGEPSSILPTTCFLGAVSWEIEAKVKRANQMTTVPAGGPPNRLYVTPELRGKVIHWAHTSMISCHPGVQRTIFRIQERFWWPTIKKDVSEYVAACSVCAQNKSSNAPPTGLLQPLPVPWRPWSDISLDFVTGLPPSEGNTTILTVDQFSKMVKFIALPKLPSAKETGEALLHHVFRIHGFPSNILSDWGPQFLAKFWEALC